MAEGGVQRRLAAIVIADLVGYSRHMERDPTGTRERFQSIQQELVEPILAKHQGRIVKTMGDAFLIEFASVVSAVAAVVEFQREMATAQASETDPIQFRIGVNLGEIIVEGDDIHGEGVNVAARLEALADPGGIAISGRVHEQLLAAIDVGYEFMGEQRVKNVARLVRAYKVLLDPADAGKSPDLPQATKKSPPSYKTIAASLVLLIGLCAVGLWYWQSQQPDFESVDPNQFAHKLPDKPSIAVLPFDNSNGDKQLTPLAHGLTDDIIYELSRFKELSIVGREANAVLRDNQKSALETGRQLKVRYIVTGSLRRTGEDIRLIINLVDVESGQHIWNNKYEFDLRTPNFFKTQDATVGDIVAAIGSDFGALTKARYAVARGRSPETFAAYECVLQAQRFFDTFLPKEFGPARTCLERTVKEDPEYAEAWAWLGGLYQEQVATGFDPEKTNSLDQGRQAIDRALNLAPNNQQAHLFLAEDHFHRRKLAATIEAAERGIGLNPNNTGMVMTLGFFIAMAGNCDRGLEVASTAVKRTPGLPSWRHIAFIKCLFEEHKFEELIEYVNKLPTLGPNENFFGVAVQNLFKVAGLDALGRREEARAFAQQFNKQQPAYVGYWYSISRFWFDPALIKRVMAAAETAGIWHPDKGSIANATKPSIAVLPFANLSNDKDQEYFADGMTDDLITDLSKVSGLIVIARNSVFTYKDKNVKVQEIAKDLNVSHVLEGSVRRDGDQIRINAQLIDAKTGSHLWAETFDREFKGIFALQDEVSRQIVVALKGKLTDEDEESLLTNRGTKSVEAYELTLRAKEFIRLKTPETFGQALKLLKKAIGLDSNYSQAHGLLARLYWVGGYGRRWFDSLDVSSVKDAYERTRMHLDIALQRPSGPAHELNARLISIQYYDNDAAVAEARKAVEIEPNYADGHLTLAWQLSKSDKPDEALVAAKPAKRIDPLNLADYHFQVGFAHYVKGEYEVAKLNFLESVKINPTNIFPRILLLGTYGHFGKMDAAKTHLEIIDAENNRTGRARLVAGIAHTWGFKEDSLKERLRSDLLKAGVPAQINKSKEVETERQLTAAETVELLSGRRLEGVMVIAGRTERKPFVWTITNDLISTFKVDGAEYVTQLFQKDGQICNERGCSRYFELNKAAAKKWNQTHVTDDPAGNRYYSTVVGRAD